MSDHRSAEPAVDSPNTQRLASAIRSVNPELFDRAFGPPPPRTRSYTPDNGDGLAGAGADASASAAPAPAEPTVASASLSQSPNEPSPTLDPAAAQRTNLAADLADDEQLEHALDDSSSYEPFADYPRETNIANVYAGLSSSDFARLPDRSSFLVALSATDSRYANEVAPASSFASDIRLYFTLPPTRFGQPLRWEPVSDMSAVLPLTFPRSVR